MAAALLCARVGLSVNQLLPKKFHAARRRAGPTGPRQARPDDRLGRNPPWPESEDGGLNPRLTSYRGCLCDPDCRYACRELRRPIGFGPVAHTHRLAQPGQPERVALVQRLGCGCTFDVEYPDSSGWRAVCRGPQGPAATTWPLCLAMNARCASMC